MKRLIVLFAVLTLFVGAANAQSLFRLGMSEQVANGATHFIDVHASDFTTEATNTAEVVGFNALAKVSVELVAIQLLEAFTTGGADTNVTESLTLAVGDEDTAARFLSATQLATESTPVWLAFPASSASAYATDVTLTNTTSDITYLDPTDDTTNTISLVTAVTAGVETSNAVSGTPAPAVYTETKEVRLTFTPHAQEATGDFTSGSVRAYFHIRDAR